MSSLSYSIGRFRFEAPADLEDKTAFTFLAQDADVVRFNLTVMREPAPQDLETYLKLAVDEMRAALSGYELVERTRLDGSLKGARLSHRAISPEGEELVQHQAFVEGPSGLLVITGSALKAAEADLLTRFSALLKSVEA